MVPHGTRTHDGNRHYSESEWNSSGRTRVYEAGRCAAGRRTWFLGHRLGTADVILCSSSMRTSCSPTRSAVIEMMQIAPSNKRPTKDPSLRKTAIRRQRTGIQRRQLSGDIVARRSQKLGRRVMRSPEAWTPRPTDAAAPFCPSGST